MIAVAAIVIPFIALANEQPNIPDNSWELRPEGVALAIVFTSDAKKSCLNVYLKNTSTVIKYCVSPDGFNRDIEIDYLNDHSEQISLRDYSRPNGGSRLTMPELKPGNIQSWTVELSASELALLKAHPAKCHICVIDESDVSMKGKWADSSPRILVKGQ
jgi:hypothetical protein